MQKLKTNKNHISHLAPHTSNHNKNVGKNCVFPHSRGITLIALIITIIVMIILVGVTVSIALNGGLFKTTEQAAKETQIEADREILQVGVAGALASEEGIINGSLLNNLPEGWNVEGAGPFTVISPNGNKFTVNADGSIKEPIELPEGWNQEAISEVITETVDGVEYKVPIPKGYVASKATGEKTIAEGLVIYEGTEEVNDSNVETARTTRNQFVWIPITEDFEGTYSGGTNYSEPTELMSNYSSSGAPYDSQATLDYLYGKNYYNYETDFAYDEHYAEMVESINKYNGFYIGRYETTIDENNEIGSKYNAEVLTGETILKDGTNPNITGSNNLYYYRWYGLYYAERNNSIIGNKDYLQTNMIWGQQWDAMIEYFDSRSINYSAFGDSSQGEIVNSGQSTNSSGEKDRIYNIYDLRTNEYEWTAEANKTYNRSGYGGYYNMGNSASFHFVGNYPAYVANYYSSRLTLYIK